MLRTITNSMIRTLKNSATISQSLRIIRNSAKTPHNFIKSITNCRNVLLSSEFYSLVKENKEDIEDILLKAQIKGKDAYVELVYILKDFLLEVCKNYQTCIQKQIEITKQATNLGPLSDKWNELPEYRTLAKDLTYELSVYLTLFKSLRSIIENNKDVRDALSRKYLEFEKMLEAELKINKQLDMELLTLNCDSILKGM